MAWNKWIRQIHRWLSMAFTAGVLINSFVIFGLKQPRPDPRLYLLASVPLLLLLLTGLYLFALPYVVRPRAARSA